MPATGKTFAMDAIYLVQVNERARSPNTGAWPTASPPTGQARPAARAAIAVCATCQVRAQCLALSLRHWDIGRHGIWGGLVAADHQALHIQKAREVILIDRGNRDVAAHGFPGERSRKRPPGHMGAAAAG